MTEETLLSRNGWISHGTSHDKLWDKLTSCDERQCHSHTVMLEGQDLIWFFSDRFFHRLLVEFCFNLFDVHCSSVYGNLACFADPFRNFLNILSIQSMRILIVIILRYIILGRPGILKPFQNARVYGMALLFVTHVITGKLCNLRVISSFKNKMNNKTSFRTLLQGL